MDIVYTSLSKESEPQDVLICTILAVAGNRGRFWFHSLADSFVQVFAGFSQRNPSAACPEGDVAPAPAARGSARAPRAGQARLRARRPAFVQAHSVRATGSSAAPSKPAGASHLQGASRVVLNLSNLKACFLQIKGRGLRFAFIGGTLKTLPTTTPRGKCKASRRN